MGMRATVVIAIEIPNDGAEGQERTWEKIK